MSARAASLSLVLLLLAGCARNEAPHAPRRFLAITHPALNRLTFFDLDLGEVVGVLPAQKLPHDLLLSPDRRTLYVVNSGAQCIATYHLDSPVLWREARAFMSRDTARTVKRGGSMFGFGSPSDSVPAAHPVVPLPESLPASPMASGGEPVYLNRQAVHALPAGVAEFHLTDPHFPDVARAAHERVNATRHRACFDCHDRSLGAKPFGPAFTPDGSIVLVHMAGRNLTWLDPVTLAVQRQVPLALPGHLQPIEVWLRPGTSEAFVTCRNEIGQSRRGVILVVDTRSGATLAEIPAGIYPWHLVPDASGSRLLVNNFQSSRLSIVDVEARAIVDSIVVQNGPAVIHSGPDSRLLYVSCFYTHKVLEVDAAKRRVIRETAVGSNPTGLLTSADGRTLYVLCGGESTLDEVDLTTFSLRKRHPLLFGAYAFQLVEP